MKTPRSSILIPGLLAAFGFGLAPMQAEASSIVGRVNDVNTGASIAGAVVTNVATGRTVYADGEGHFRMDDVAPGQTELHIDDVGYGPKVETVTVPENGSTPVQILMGDKALKLDALVVEGYREGWAKALQQKQNATDLRDVLSSDAAGNLPDNNVGEALARLPGVALDVDFGEGHYISIRGTDPNLNSVTMNGATMATPPELGRTGRSAPMDMLGTGMITQVEVIKTLTPDMDGTSLGGTVNIRTPSGFDHHGEFISGSVQYGQNEATNLPIYAADFTYQNIFGNPNQALGVAVTADFEERNTSRDLLMNQWGGNAAQAYIVEPRLDLTTDKRDKVGGALDLDYRLSTGTRVYLRAFYNQFTEVKFTNEQLYTSQGAATLLTPTEVSFPSVQYDLRKIDYIRHSKMTNLALGGTQMIAGFKVDAEATYSSAPDNQPEYLNFSFRAKSDVPGGYIIDFGNLYPKFNISSIVATANPPVRQLRRDTIDNEENVGALRVDVQRDFPGWFGNHGGFIKVGAKYTHRHRDDVRNVGIYTAPGVTLANLDATTVPPKATSVLDGRYSLPVTLSHDVLAAGFYSLLAQGKAIYGQSASLSNVGEDTYNVIEEVEAAYAMASFNLTKKLTLLAGFRDENTHAPLEGPVFYPDPVTGGATVANQSVKINYNEFLPNVQARYKLSHSTYMRAALTKTFGRPAYADMVPSGTLDNVGGVLTTGNPNLKPYESLNYDASIEHYFQSGGIISVALFYKTIKNPIYTFSYNTFNVNYAGYFFPVFTISNKQNGLSARQEGAEISYKLPFASIIQGFADGFGVDVNASFMNSSVTVATRPGEDLRLFDSPNRIYNAGLFYEKNGISARIAYNYKSDSLQTIGVNPFTDVYSSARYYWDAQLSYKVSEHWKIFGNWQNITNQPVNFYTASSNRHIYQSYWFGSNIRAGMKFTF